jgi:hypothetical protein
VPAVAPVAASRSRKVTDPFAGGANTAGTAIRIASGTAVKNSFTRHVPAFVLVAVSRSTLPEANDSVQRSAPVRSSPITGISRWPLTP